MDYIDLNPITEVESSDSETPDMYQIQMQISLEDLTETPETPLSALLRQESVKSKYEFSRQDSQIKSKPPSIDSFPSIRGLEVEHTKSLVSEPSSNLGRRASNLLRSNITDSLRGDSFFDRDSMRVPEEEVKTLSSEATDRFFSRGTTKRTKTFNALDNVEELRHIIKTKSLSPEMMLISAIGSIYEFDYNSKKKENFLIEMALDYRPERLFLGI